MTRHNPTMVNLGWGSHLGRTDTLKSLWLLGRYPIRIQTELVDAVKAMEQALLATGYENPCDYIGSYHYRPISGRNIYSTHAYGTAIDLDYGGDTDGDGDPTIDKNPHLHRPIVPGDPAFGFEIQILEHQVRAIEAIRNTQGQQVWKWLGWPIGDSMHWQANVSPTRTTIDWDTVPQENTNMSFTPWANGLFDEMSDDEILELGHAGYWQPGGGQTIEEGADYWITLRDIGATQRTPAQRKEVARLIETCQVSSWLNTARSITP